VPEVTATLVVYSGNWLTFAIRGLVAIAFGVAAVAVPGLALWALVLLFGAYAIVDGGILLGALIIGRPEARHHTWEVAIIGALGIAAGVTALVYPGITALALLYVAAFWAITTGLMAVIAAIRLRREIQGEIWLGLGGLISIVFGLFLIAFPGAGLLSLVWLVGVWAIAFGLSNLLLAFRLRSHRMRLRAT
jgi:uncharacterized membrane protein HdeD (DUF308 family)